MNRGVSRAANAIRWMTAGTVILGVFLAPFESLLPDVHDIAGSVASAQSVSYPGIVSSGTSEERSSLPLDSPSHRTNSHPFRVDHCSHNHYLSLGSHVTVTIGDNRKLFVETLSPELVSVSLSPKHRPPIA